LTSETETMKSTMRTRTSFFRVLAVLLLAGSLGLGATATARAAESAGYDTKRDPAADLKAAIHQTKTNGRRILLEVGGEWCSWCHVLHELFTTDKEIRERLREDFVVVKVNWSSENENTQFLSAYPPIEGYPHLFVLESEGTFLWSQNTGEFEKRGNGYDRGKVLAFLKHWSPQAKNKT
jgi:thioredoxin-related protein